LTVAKILHDGEEFPIPEGATAEEVVQSLIAAGMEYLKGLTLKKIGLHYELVHELPSDKTPVEDVCGIFYTKHNTIQNPICWRLPLPKSCRIKAEVYYGCNDGDWFCSHDLSGPTWGCGSFPQVKGAMAVPYMSAHEAARAALEDVIEELHRRGKRSDTSAAQKRDIENAVKTVQEMIAAYFKTPDDGTDETGWPIPSKIRLVFEGTLTCTREGTTVTDGVVSGMVNAYEIEPQEFLVPYDIVPEVLNAQVLELARGESEEARGKG
jgi:hypothetical protein